MYRKYFKRLFDFCCSFLALIVLSPVLLIIAILVRIKLGAPVFFKQKRPGLHEKVFMLYKFRTMTNQKDEKGNLLPDEVRLSKFGKILRSTSLDELPELLNVLKGDMSIVGPRPLLEKYIPLYSAEQKKRHLVRPGVTGLAQINGRNELDWDRKFQLDVEYVKQITFFYDLLIIIKTFRSVFQRTGISSVSSATMEEFVGNKLNEDNKKEFKA